MRVSSTKSAHPPNMSSSPSLMRALEAATHALDSPARVLATRAVARSSRRPELDSPPLRARDSAPSSSRDALDARARGRYPRARLSCSSTRDSSCRALAAPRSPSIGMPRVHDSCSMWKDYVAANITHGSACTEAVRCGGARVCVLPTVIEI